MPEPTVFRRLERHEIVCVQPLVRELEAALLHQQEVTAEAAGQVAAARARLGWMVRLMAGAEEVDVALDPGRMVLFRANGEGGG